MMDDIHVAVKEHGVIKAEWKVFSNRSLSQNALFHVWCRELAESFTKRDKTGEVYTEGQMKMLMKHQFLGYEDITIGKTEIEKQLISTRSLAKGEMYQFMEQVLAWSFDVGVPLSTPDDSEFVKLRNSQHDT